MKYQHVKWQNDSKLNENYLKYVKINLKLVQINNVVTKIATTKKK